MLLCAHFKFFGYVYHFCVAPESRCRRRFGDPSVLFVRHTATSVLFVFVQRSSSEITHHAFLMTHGNFLGLCLIRLRRLCVVVIEQITANRSNTCVLQGLFSTRFFWHGSMRRSHCTSILFQLMLVPCPTAENAATPLPLALEPYVCATQAALPQALWCFFNTGLSPCCRRRFICLRAHMNILDLYE